MLFVSAGDLPDLPEREDGFIVLAKYWLMTAHNSEIAEIFDEVADLLEIEGANEFRIRAYRNASRVISGLSRSAAELIAKEEKLAELPGIGKDLAGKIAEICQTGKLPVLEECRARVAPGIRQLMRIPGLGPKRIRLTKKLNKSSLTARRVPR